MSAGNTPDDRADANGQLLPDRIAELAGELSETESESQRQRLASQIPKLASRSGQAAWRGMRAGQGAAGQNLRARRDAAARWMGPTRDAAARAVRTGRDSAVRGAQGGGQAARRSAQRGGAAARHGLQAGGTLAWRGAQGGGQWLVSQVLEMAPKIPVRGIGKLRAQHPGLDTEELASLLIESAARASAGVGAAVGVAAAVPFIPTTAAELAVETLALVAIELKLVAELHEVYGRPAPGSVLDRSVAYLSAWANRRGVQITAGGLAVAVGSPLRRKLEQRLVAKAGQSVLSLAPLLAGAAAGAFIDHRETRRLGTLVRNDLRKLAAQPPAVSQ